MLSCPYPDCPGEVAICGNTAFCNSCKEPVSTCPTCGAANRAFSRYCRRCRKLARFQNFRATQAGKLDLPAALRKPPAEVIVEDTFWIAPVSFQGYLWCLSSEGRVWRVNPIRREALLAGHLGLGFGRSLFLVRSVAFDNPERALPSLVAVGPRHLKSLNLSTGQVQTIHELPEGSRFLASIEQDGAVGIQIRGTQIFALKKQADRVSLVSCNALTRVVEETPLTSALADGPTGQPIGGPIKVGDRVCVYDSRTLHLVEGDRRVSIGFPEGIVAHVTATETGFFPLGLLPWIVYGDALYLAASEDGCPGFLFTSFRHTPPSPVFIPLGAPASYSRDADGRLVVCRPERMSIYNGAAPTIENDPQLVPSGAEYFDDPLSVYLVKSAGIGQRLRFRWKSEPQDAVLPTSPDRIDIIRFQSVGTALMLLYFARGLKLGLAIWDVC